MTRNDANLFEAFCQSASDHAGRKCLIHKKEGRYESLKYAQVLSEILALRRALGRRGIRPGERVAILLSNGPLWPVSFFAVVSLQAVAVPIDTQLNPEHIKEILRHAGVRCLLTEEKFSVALSDVLCGGIEVIFPERADPDAGPDECPPPRDGFPSSKLAALFYTSGTTKGHKAVMLTHANFLANVRAMHSLGLITKNDLVVSILPLHHTYPFMVTCLIPLLEGAGVCYVPSLVPHELFSAFRENGVTILVGVPQFFALIERSVSEKMKKYGPVVSRGAQAFLDICVGISKVRGRRIICPFVRKFHQLLGQRLRFFVSGGAKLDAATASNIHRLGFAVMEGYGLTETAPIVTLNADRSSQFNSVGKSLPGVDVEIIAPDSRGVGEVAVRGANVMLGYYRAPRLTRDVLKNGWFLTGDLGRMDAQGYLHLEGRKNEIIVLPSGKKVNPEEVEAVYMRSVFIKELCVFYSAEGPEAGHLAAVIVPDEDRLFREKHVDMHFKIRWELDSCASRLAPYQRIKGFVLTAQALPRTRLGKLVRYKIASLCASGQIKEPLKTAAEGLGAFESAALGYLSRILKKDVRMDDHLELDLGLDSLGRIELLSSLQELVNAGIDDTLAYELFQARTVRELIDKAGRVLPQDAFRGLLKREDAVSWSHLLVQEPSQETKARLQTHFDIFEKAATLIVVFFLQFFVRIVFALRVRGRGQIPKTGPFIMASSHVSYLDPFYILCALPFNRIADTYFVGFGAILRHPLIAWAIRFFRLVPIDANIDLAEALKTCRYLLHQGKVLVYFPEGQRSGDGHLKEFRKGLGILIKESGAGVVPVYLEGAYKAWPRGRSFPLPAAVIVKVGAFVPSNRLVASGQDEDYSAIAEAVRRRVEDLMKE